MEKLKQHWIDFLQINSPTAGMLAFISTAELKDWVSIVCMIGGLGCSIWVAHHKTKNQKDKQ